MAIYILNDGSWKESTRHTAYPHKALVIKTPPANAGDKSCEFDPWVGEDPPGEGNGNPLQCSCLENLMGRGAWLATVHRVEKSKTWLKRLSMHTQSQKTA